LEHSGPQIQYVIADICKEETLSKLNLNQAIFFLLAPTSMQHRTQLMIDSKNIMASKNIHGFDLTSMIFLQIASPSWNVHPWIDADWTIDTMGIKTGKIREKNKLLFKRIKVK
jgi:hypothetical protein